MRAEGARKRAAEGPVRPKERRRKQNGRLWWSHATVAYHRAIGINVDLRLVDVAAFRAAQGPANPRFLQPLKSPHVMTAKYPKDRDNKIDRERYHRFNG